jgi:lipopolysaccharide export system protein LptA
MRWQSVLRIGIALAFVGVAVLVYLNLRQRPVATTPAEVAPLSEPNVLSESFATDKPAKHEFLAPDGTPAMVIAYQRAKMFADGRKEFEDINATFLRAGVKNTIVAKRAVATGKAGPTGEQPSEVVFTGDVQLSSEDGISVKAKDEATFYNIEQKTVIPGAMSFTRGRLSGSGVGADLYMDRSVLWINSQAKLSVAPEKEGGSPIEAQAGKIGLADAEHYMVLEGDAVMNHQSQRLSANNARVSFSAEGDLVQFIELRERSRVVSTGSRKSQPNLTAENINLTFAPDTGLLTHTKLVQGAVVELKETSGVTKVSGSDIDIFVGPDGETLTKLEATAPVQVSLPQQGGQPAKVITSSGLMADGDDTRGLTRAEFSGGVKYTEKRPAGRGQAASSREATSQKLVLGLKGDLAQVDTAVFTQNFTVIDGELTATAHEGTYDSVKETLRLRSVAGTKSARPKVTTSEMEVVGNEIDAELKIDGFRARGDVESFLTPSSKTKTTKTTQSGGLFEAGKRISGRSDSLTYHRDAGTAVYEGAVFLVQEDSSLRADRVDIDDVKGDLVAKGKVTSKLTLQPEKPGAPAPKPAVISAALLVYSDSARTAVYTGAATLETSTGEHLSGEQITLTLDPSDRKLKTAEAVAAPGGEVRVTLPEGRQAVGVKAIYTAATEAYQVHGKLAAFIVPAPEEGPGRCSVGNGTVLDFNRMDGASQVRSEGGALGRMKPAKCSDVIKVIK